LAAAFGIAAPRSRFRADAALSADAGRGRGQQQRDGYRDRGHPYGYGTRQPGHTGRQHEHKKDPYQVADQALAGSSRHATRSHDVGGKTGSRCRTGKIGGKVAQFPVCLGRIRRADTFVELLAAQPAHRVGLAEQLNSALSILI
jgi:hypothetical protein